MMKWRRISSAKPFYFPFPHQGSFPILLERESNVFYSLRQVQSKQMPSFSRTLLRQEGSRRSLVAPDAPLTERRGHDTQANIVGAKPRRPWFKSQVIHLIVGWPFMSYLHLLSTSHACNIGSTRDWRVLSEVCLSVGSGGTHCVIQKVGSGDHSQSQNWKNQSQIQSVPPKPHHISSVDVENYSWDPRIPKTLAWTLNVAGLKAE